MMRFLIKCVFLAPLFVSTAAIGESSYPTSYLQYLNDEFSKSIDIDLSAIKPGVTMAIRWGNSRVYIYRRTKEDIVLLNNYDRNMLADPDDMNTKIGIMRYLRNISNIPLIRVLLHSERTMKLGRYRSLRDEYFVFLGYGSHNSCRLVFKPKEYINDKNKIFFNPCNGAYFDSAGRVLPGRIYDGNGGKVESRYNLFIVPYRFTGEASLQVGLGKPISTIPAVRLDLERVYASLTPTMMLLHALRFNDRKAVMKAIKSGADITYNHILHGSVLDAAILGSDSKMVRFLVRHGARVSVSSYDLARSVSRTDLYDLFGKQ